MPDIDVPAITDKLATAMATATYTAPSLGRDYLALVAAVRILPVIAEALYAPILALHKPHPKFRAWCDECAKPGAAPFVAYPCPTVTAVEAALDAIRGQA